MMGIRCNFTSESHFCQRKFKQSVFNNLICDLKLTVLNLILNINNPSLQFRNVPRNPKKCETKTSKSNSANPKIHKSTTKQQNKSFGIKNYFNHFRHLAHINILQTNIAGLKAPSNWSQDQKCAHLLRMMKKYDIDVTLIQEWTLLRRPYDPVTKTYTNRNNVQTILEFQSTHKQYRTSNII